MEQKSYIGITLLKWLCQFCHNRHAFKNIIRKTWANLMFIWEYYPKEQVGRNESRLILCASPWICNFKVQNFRGEWREKKYFFINSSLHSTRAAQWVLILSLLCWMYTSMKPFFLTLILWIRELTEQKKWYMWQGLETQYHSLHKVSKALVGAFSPQQWCWSEHGWENM